MPKKKDPVIMNLIKEIKKHPHLLQLDHNAIVEKYPELVQQYSLENKTKLDRFKTFWWRLKKNLINEDEKASKSQLLPRASSPVRSSVPRRYPDFSMMPFYAPQPVQHTIHQTVFNFNNKASYIHTDIESSSKKESVPIDQKN